MKLVNNILAVLSALSLVWALGCGRGEDQNGPIRPADGDVLVAVNGREITFGWFRQIIDLEAEIKFVTGQFKEGEAEKIAYKKIRESEFMPQLVSCELLRQEFVRCGLELPGGTAERKAQEINGMLGGGFSLYDLAAKMNLSREVVDWWLLLGEYERPLLEKLYPDLLTIGTNDLRIVRERMKVANERMGESNAVLKASAQRVLKLAREGKALSEIAKAEPWLDGAEAEHWSTFAKSEIKNPALREWAFKAKPGEVGGPFDLPEGLVIAKVLEVQDGADDISSVAIVVRQVKLGRLVVPQVALYPEVGDSELLEEIRRARTRESRVELLKRLADSAAIVYPLGKGSSGEDTAKKGESK